MTALEEAAKAFNEADIEYRQAKDAAASSEQARKEAGERLDAASKRYAVAMDRLKDAATLVPA